MSAVPTKRSVEDKIAGTVDATSYARINGVVKDAIETQHRIVNKGHKKIIQIGTGVSGIAQAAILLKNKVISLEDLVIFDVQDNFGGVWEKNRYPGCACDVPSLLYTNRLMINTEYDHYYATREQIADFYVRMANHYHLTRSTQFRTLVTTCCWDDEEFVWRVTADNQRDGTVEEWTSDVVIHAVGAFDRPKFGNTPGLSSFKGQYWHTSRWNDNLDLRGKRVAIIGCGPSAGQVIPQIIDKVEQLTVYMRTPPMILPRNDFKRSRIFMFCMRNIPMFAFLARTLVMMQTWLFGAWVVTKGSYLNKSFSRKAHRYLDNQVRDPKLRELLRPNFAFFCKRPLFLDDFYSSLIKSNCTVVREDLTTFTESGIASVNSSTNEKKHRDFDVILFATGFNLSQYLQHETVIGHKGINLQDQWKDHPSCIYGVATTNFPNFFMCNGPNGNTFSSTHHEMNEVSSGYVSRVLSQIFRRERAGKRIAVMPKASFEQAYNDEIQKNIGHIVPQDPSCNSYYKNKEGHNTIVHHRNIWALWWRLRQVNWSEWDIFEAPT